MCLRSQNAYSRIFNRRSLHPDGLGVDALLRRGQSSFPRRESHRGRQLLAARQHLRAVRDERAAADAGQLPGHAAAGAVTTVFHTWQAAPDRRHVQEVENFL